MKIRIGYGLGTRSESSDHGRFTALVDGLEAGGFDSLWLSERITGDCPDPLVAMSYAAGRTSHLKFGMSVMVLPGRNPMLLAKELATLQRLSEGRLLPAFGLGVTDPREQQAFGVDRKERAARFDEALPLIRRFWTEDAVDHNGRFFHYESASVRPHPTGPIDVWLGGTSDPALRRCGQLADGWLPSFCTPTDVAAGIPVIQEHAAAAGREVDPEHFGVLLVYADGEIPDLFSMVAKNRRPELEPEELVAIDLAAARDRIEEFIAAGASKFVLVPLAEPENWANELARVEKWCRPLQN